METSAKNSRLALLLLTLLAFQFGLQPILYKSFGKQADPTSIVLTTEITKVVLSASIILWSKKKLSWNFIESLKVAAGPSFLFVVQNFLILQGQRNVPPLVFNLLNQTKTLFAALCLFLIMGKRQTKPQMLALCLLMAASTILTGGGEKQPPRGGGGGGGGGGAAAAAGALAPLAALAPVFGGSFLSGLNAALVQRALQGAGARDGVLLSLELSAYSIAWGLLRLALRPAARAALLGAPGGFFGGWTWATWLPVLNNSLGGLLVGQVTKHAGSVEKGFALVAGILVTALLQTVLYAAPLTMDHGTAFALVVGSTWLHTSYPHTAGGGEEQQGSSSSSLLADAVGSTTAGKAPATVLLVEGDDKKRR